MKNRLKNVFLVALIFFSNTIFAQLTEQSQADDLKISENIFEELDVFLEQNKDYKLSNAEQMKFESMFLESDDDHHHEEINEEIVKSNFIKEILTEKFYNNNPKYREVFAKTFSFPNPCFNGGFETASLTTYSAFYRSRTTLLQCGEVPANVPGSYFPITISPLPSHGQLVTNGFDPNIPTLSRTYTGNKALRVNLTAPGGMGSSEIAVLRKGFSPSTTGTQNVSFYSAIVISRDHNSTYDGFFLARIVDTSGIVVGDPICITSATLGLPWNTTGEFDWLDWECFSIPYFGNAGQNYFLEIATGDCKGGLHPGYAYVDNICMNTCGVPIDLECIKTTAGQHLSWSAMPGAVSYEIVFNFNDPLCCPAGGGLPSSTIVNSITNSYNVPISFSPCFSWSVRAVYSDGTKSGFSERECSCNECPKPIDLGCVTIDNYRLLSWGSVFGSSGYEVMITYNDPTCGCSGTVSTIVISTVSNWLEVIDVSTCFSWKVRSKCAGDLYSEWSDIACSCIPSSSSFIQNEPIMSVKQHLKSDSYITVSPNPADQIVTFELQNKSGDDVQNAELKIISLEGKIVYQSTISLNEKKNVDVSGILPGMYIFVVSTDSLLIDAGKLIIK